MKRSGTLLLIALGGCATSHVQGSVHIARPAEDVFDAIADQRNEPQYNPEMEQVQLVSPEPVGAGSSFQVQLRSRGDLLPMTVTYTDFDRPHRLGSHTTLESMEIAGALTCTPEQGGTRLAWEWELRPKGWLVLMGPLIGHMGARQEERIWGTLKQKMEAGEILGHASTTLSPGDAGPGAAATEAGQP